MASSAEAVSSDVSASADVDAEPGAANPAVDAEPGADEAQAASETPLVASSAPSPVAAPSSSSVVAAPTSPAPLTAANSSPTASTSGVGAELGEKEKLGDQEAAGDKLQRFQAQRDVLEQRRSQVLQRLEDAQFEDASSSDVAADSPRSARRRFTTTGLPNMSSASASPSQPGSARRRSIALGERLAKGSRQFSKPGSSGERFLDRDRKAGSENKEDVRESAPEEKPKPIKKSPKQKAKNYAMHMAEHGEVHVRLAQLAATLRISQESIIRLNSIGTEKERELRDLRQECDAWRSEAERLQHMGQALQKEARHKQLSPKKPRRPLAGPAMRASQTPLAGPAIRASQIPTAGQGIRTSQMSPPGSDVKHWSPRQSGRR